MDKKKKNCQFPARPTDLTLCYFEMWGLFKIVKPKTVEHRSLEHKELIAGHFYDFFTAQLCNKIYKSVLKKCKSIKTIKEATISSFLTG